MVGIWTEIRASNLERQVGLFFVAMSSGVCKLTIRKVCNINRLKQRLQGSVTGDEAYIFILLCHLTFCLEARWLTEGFGHVVIHQHKKKMVY